MELDENLCLCFHVTKRKVLNFIRIERPQRAGQLSQCFGAGTGCGWCRPFLQRLFDQAIRSGQIEVELPTAADYAQMRQSYQRDRDDRPAAEGEPAEDWDAQRPTGQDWENRL